MWTDYPVLVTIDTITLISIGKMISDFGNLRLLYSNKTIFLYY